MKKISIAKKLIIGSALVLSMGLITACGGSKKGSESEGTAVEQTADFNTQELADKLKSDGNFKDQLQELEADVAISKLYALDAASIESSAFYTNTNATAEEIAVIKCASADYVQTVVDAFNKRVADQKTACADYLPDELPKLDAAVIKTSGNYVVFCVSMDSAKAEEIISQYMK